MTDAAGAEAWSYDPMGRVLADERKTTGVTKTTSYTYNLDGSLATLTYPTGRIVTYTPGADGRSLSAVDKGNGINYGLSAAYAPQGALAYLQNGANLYSTRIYSDRLQPCWFYAATGAALAWNTTLCTSTATAGNILDLKYSFNLGAGDNGNVTAITNNRVSARTQNFTYDQLNRIATGTTASTSGSYCWGEQFGYDPWGNLVSISAASGYNSCTQEYLSLGMNGNNQITNSGFSYDLSGNLLADGVNSYAWNAESELKSAAGVTYTYDGLGNRVEKSNGTLYWYGPAGEILDETDLSGNLVSEYVYFAGRRIARRDAGGNVFYYVEDLLGSSRTIVQAGQTAFGGVYPERSRRNADFYPGVYPERSRRGGERTVCIPDGFAGRVYTNTCVQHYKFMSHERDAESGLDDFGARYYSSQYGRFLSADWSAIPVAVPYAHFTNPQTLNLYAIVHDNPESFADLDGHYGEDNNPGAATNPANQAKKKCEEGGQCGQPAPPAEQPAQQQQATRASVGDRIAQGGEALLNFAVGIVKTGLALGSAGAAPETAGTSLAATAYLGVSAAANFTAGSAQLAGAATGNTKSAAQAAQAAAASGTVSGLLTLVKTNGNLTKASRNAAIEGVVTTNPSDLMKGGTVTRVTKLVDYAKTLIEAATGH